MATLEIELPDGRTVEIDVPEGVSMEQAAQEVDAMYSSGGFGEAPAAAAPPAQEPGMLGKVEQAASRYFPPYGIVKGMFGEGQTAGGMESYGRGAMEGAASIPRGIRQGFNALTGDQAELEQLNQQEAAARQQFEQDTGGDTMGSLGKFVGSVGPSVAASGLAAAAAPVSIPAGLAGMALRAGGGAAAGALGGATQALTPEEEAAGNRGEAAQFGAVLGGAAPLAFGAAGSVADALRRVSPEEAVEGFAKSALGASREKGASSAYAGLRGKTEEAFDAASKKLKAAYTAVESQADEPVFLRNVAELGDEMELPDVLRAKLSPRFRQAVAGAKAGAVDEAGAAKGVKFAEVRDAIRDLRSLQRGMPQDSPDVNRVGAVIDVMQRDLDDWAAAAPKNKSVLDAARQVDSQYREEVVPFLSKKSPIGAMLRGGKGERDVDLQFLRDNSGEAIDQLKAKVPGAEGDLRELYGTKLLDARLKGPGASRAAFEGGTTGEKLLQPQEAAYLRDVAKAVRDDPNVQTSLSPTLESLLRKAGAGKLQTAMGGVLPYGQKKVKPTAIGDFLRAYTAGQTIREEE